MKNFNEDMERSVLGSMVLNPEFIPNITHAVSEMDFYLGKHREMFREIVAMSDNGEEINIVTLSARLHGRYAIDVAQLTDVVPSGANWQFYCQKVSRLSQLRLFREIMSTAGDVNEENITEKLNGIAADAARIAEASGGGKIKTARDFILPMIEYLEDALKRKEPLSGYDTGLMALNGITDGLQDEYIIIGARASIGKTALGINISRALVQKGVKTAFFSLEMSGKALLLRILSDLTNQQAWKMKSGLFVKNSIEPIQRAGYRMAEWPLYILDDTRGEFDQIIAKTRYMVRCLGVQAVFIDHASLLKYKDRKLPRYEQFAEMSNALQNLQRELKVPIVVMAQLTRGAEGKRPTIADLRESGAFEQDADQVWIIHRERELEQGADSIDTDLIVAKNRNGACGTAELLFQPHFVRFVDKADKRYEGGNK